MLVTLIVTAVTVSLCFFLHLGVLTRLARRVYHPEHSPSRPLLLIIFVLFATHLLQVSIYALALSGLDAAGYGQLAGAVAGGAGWWLDHFYFSIASFTTLGIGDIVPSGELRLLAGIEALNGLVLITWSASFTYLAMERQWGSRHGIELGR